MMKNVLIILILFISQAVLAQADGKTERNGEPTIYDVDSGDEQINDAIRKSRLTFDDFIAAFKTNDGKRRNFSVKMPFATEFGAEHIWLTNMEFKGEKLIGIVDNLPQSVTTVRLGDAVEIEKDKISDWFYIENDKLIGGLTIRVLRDRMSNSERKRFDRTLGAKID
jgi:uncharacterized protein YegJ (DUF2314 family)